MRAAQSLLRGHDTLLSLTLAVLVPATVWAIGVRDLESYQHAMFSLVADSPGRVSLLGIPVYEAGVGLGARLPLHGNFTAHPLAPLLAQTDARFAYFTLFAVHLFVSTRLLTAAARRLGGTGVWAVLPAVLLSVSLPVVCYSVSNDWPETLTGLLGMAACVGGVLWLPAWTLRGYPTYRSAAAHALVGLSVPGLIAASGHPGYWPITTVAVVLALLTRIAVAQPSLRVMARAACFAAAGWLLPGVIAVTTALDLRAEWLAAGAGARRHVQGPVAWTLDALTGTAGAGTRIAFAAPLLALALLAATLGSRRRKIAAALLFAWLGCTVLAQLTPGDPYWFLPSTIWGFRDPGIVFAVLAVPVAAQCGRTARALAAVGSIHVIAASVLALAALGDRSEGAWTHGTPAVPDSVPALLSAVGAREGDRILLSREVAQAMRGRAEATGIHALSDLAAAGFHTVAAWTKVRQLEWALASGDPHETWVVPTDEAVCSTGTLRLLGIDWLAVDAAVAASGACADVFSTAGGSPVQLGGVDAVVAALPRARLATVVGEPRPDAAEGRCPILSRGDCIDELGIAFDGPRWETDPSGAIRFTADPDRWVVVPIDWDSALRATTRDGKRLPVVEHLGLAAIGPTPVDRTEVTVRWSPDARATSRVAATWLALLVLVVGGPFAIGVLGRQREFQPPPAPL